MNAAARAALFTLLSLGTLAADGVHAESNTDNSGSLAATARLDFTINIGKFLYLRVGADGTGVSNVAFALTPSIPPAAASPLTGNSMPVNWNGAAPSFTVAATGAVLPVEVRSNAGTVTLRGGVITPLSNGASTIPMSQITITSSEAINLPAPLLPNAGLGTSVNVVGTAFSGLVTSRTANWTFNFAPPIGSPPAAGNYAGQVQFTASAP